MNEKQMPFLKSFSAFRFSLKKTVPTTLTPHYRLLYSLPVLRQRKAHYSNYTNSPLSIKEIDKQTKELPLGVA